MFQVNHFGYCGMADVPSTYECSEHARDYAAERLRRYRRRFRVVTLEPGKAWEICEPDNCTMVPDACGTLRLSHITYECRECGSACETREEWAHCCADYGCEEIEEGETA